MKRLLLIVIVVLLIPTSGYSVCIFGKGATCEKKEKTTTIVQKEEKKEKKDCFYIIPFNESIYYIFKMSSGGKCQEMFQVGYMNASSLDGVVLKPKYKDNMAISYRTSFDNREELQGFLNETWKNIKTIHHKSVRSLTKQ